MKIVKLNIKNLILTSILTITFLSGNAQIQKGDWYLSGQFTSYNDATKTTYHSGNKLKSRINEISLTGTIGKVIGDHWVLGLEAINSIVNTGYEYNENGLGKETTGYQLSIAPKITYYKNLNGKWTLFASVKDVLDVVETGNYIDKDLNGYAYYDTHFVDLNLRIGTFYRLNDRFLVSASMSILNVDWYKHEWYPGGDEAKTENNFNVSSDIPSNIGLMNALNKIHLSLTYQLNKKAQ